MIIDSLTTVRNESAQIIRRNIFFGWCDNDHESIGCKWHECLATVGDGVRPYRIGMGATSKDGNVRC